MAYVSGHLASLMSSPEALAHIGLASQIQEAMTDPTFSHIVGTQTLGCRASDIAKQIMLLFLTINNCFKVMPASKNKRPRHEYSRNPSMTATINMMPQDFQFPDAHVIVQADVNILDDHISLYKGKAYKELRQPVKSLGDMGRSTYGIDWKKFIWTCKRECPQPDPKVDYLWKPGQADVIRGPIYSDINKSIVCIPEENVQSDINEASVMRLPSGKKASQCVFIQEYTIRQLAEEIRGKMHFIIFEGTARSSAIKV
ncbi:uncharacterized protein N7518_002112 [Penicillium psychrosexuale]|uniref:uncharacterized protein n=1 Tax=Penicillium psychrosexuale TaxID=1002107 RepID=UPI0025458B37|nr:uncharacterized protein N7518_002112 [Penicillium psychrosexuale]KAJ5800044.1 hypothetical protein N7518_002112 [Penicillium psychrosexuale]